MTLSIKLGKLGRQSAILKCDANLMYTIMIPNHDHQDDCHGLQESIQPISLNCSDSRVCSQWKTRPPIIFSEPLIIKGMLIKNYVNLLPGQRSKQDEVLTVTRWVYLPYLLFVTMFPPILGQVGGNGSLMTHHDPLSPWAMSHADLADD